MEIALLKAGDFFGEMAMLDSQPRSATVTCLTALPSVYARSTHFYEPAASRRHPDRLLLDYLRVSQTSPGCLEAGI